MFDDVDIDGKRYFDASCKVRPSSLSGGLNVALNALTSTSPAAGAL